MDLNSNMQQNDTTPMDCIKYINEFNKDLQPYQTLSLLVPSNDDVWEGRSMAWLVL